MMMLLLLLLLSMLLHELACAYIQIQAHKCAPNTDTQYTKFLLTTVLIVVVMLHANKKKIQYGKITLAQEENKNILLSIKNIPHTICPKQVNSQQQHIKQLEKKNHQFHSVHLKCFFSLSLVYLFLVFLLLLLLLFYFTSIIVSCCYFLLNDSR